MNKRQRILESKFVNSINESAKSPDCLLCGKKISTQCNSHVVPRFILRGLMENGKVAYGYSFEKGEVNGLNKETGLNNAHTFRLICKECDAKTFADYENPDNLLGFDDLDENTKKKVLCEMAMKTHLSHISMKAKMMAAQNNFMNGKLYELEKQGRAIITERIDIDEHQQYLRNLKKNNKSNKNPFVVLYNKVLDYQTKIATQTIINYCFDLEGNKIFDKFDVFKENKCTYFYLMVLPFGGMTRVLFYIERNYLPNVKPIVDQFELLTDDEKLHFLFVSLIMYSQQFYMAPSFSKMINKKDKKLVKLYRKTEITDAWLAKIQDFRKYTNYLLEEYNNPQ